MRNYLHKTKLSAFQYCQYFDYYLLLVCDHTFFDVVPMLIVEGFLKKHSKHTTLIINLFSLIEISDCPVYNSHKTKYFLAYCKYLSSSYCNQPNCLPKMIVFQSHIICHWC